MVLEKLYHMAHEKLSLGDIEVVIGDNAGHKDHRAGYNGIWSLRHKLGTRNLFVPAYAGFNLEHFFNGETEFLNRDVFFQPRRHPMELKKLNDSQVELTQESVPHFFIESSTRFTLRRPHYVDVDFNCKPLQHAHDRGWFGCFWASYVNGPIDKSMYFKGGWKKGDDLWMQLCTQKHDDESTVSHFDDNLKLDFLEGSRDALFKNHSPMRFSKTFYYGHFEDLTYIIMFNRSKEIRFTHSPSGGGYNQKGNTSNPAWDFQFLVPKYEVLQQYGYRARIALRKRCSRFEILTEYENFLKS